MSISHPPEQPTPKRKRSIPEGTWIQCPGCKAPIVNKEAERKLRVCPNCDHHMYVSARQRIEQVLDSGTFEEWDADLLSADPLEFADKSRTYTERVAAEQKKTGLSDAALTGTGMIRARRVAIGITDSQFIMGSMGSVVGERLRMHEGIFSLMQMAKISAALARYDEAGGLFISVLTNPTMGGVAASFASLGDVVFAEPRALIGFAGPRTIKATIRVELPAGFQTSEFLLEHGFIDRIVSRDKLKTEIARTIDYCGK